MSELDEWEDVSDYHSRVPKPFIPKTIQATWKWLSFKLGISYDNFDWSPGDKQHYVALHLGMLTIIWTFPNRGT